MTVFIRPTMKTGVICLATWLSLASLSLGQATKPAEMEGPQIGKIKGDNVYVRSGSHLNYYPVTKLNRGDSVTVVGEQYGWLEILPPTGAFSLIEKTYVDRSGDTGTLNGDRWVNAGSNIVDDSRYAKQVKLKRGDTVHILGESKDGAFLKIEPPAGAHVWVKADFVEGVSVKGIAPKPKTVERVAPGNLALEGDTSPTTRPSSGVAKVTTRPSSGGIVMRGTPGKRTGEKRAQSSEERKTVVSSDTYQPQISAIEAELEAVNTMPTEQRSYDKLLSKLRPMAEQKEDEIARLYAEARIKQIEGHTDAQSAANEVAKLREDAIRNADDIAKNRRPIPPLEFRPLDAIVVRGEIRTSSVFEGAAGRPKRWRVVESNGQTTARTLAYLQLPPDSTLNPADYYGKYVGIRASARQISGEVTPIPIYTVAEIVVLDSSSRPARGFSGSSAYASPPSRPIVVPTSQPTTAPGE